MKILIALLFMYGSMLYAETPSGEVILERIDKNFDAKTQILTATMIVKGRRGTRTVKSKTWAEGEDKAFTEYLSPAREKGTKMLKLGDELWTWTPSADRTIKIAGHMLRQSMMGSDISYEDIMENPKLSEIYDSKIIEEEELEGRACYVLGLTATQDNIAYHSRKLWVDKERYLPLKEERFAKSGKLLKTLVINEVFKVGNRWYPKKMTFKDVLKKGSGTEFIIDSIKFNVKIPNYIFSKAALRR